MNDLPNGVCCLVLCQFDKGYSHLSGENLNRENASIRSGGTWGRAQHVVGVTTPGLVALGAIRKQAEQATKSESPNFIPPQPLTELLPLDSFLV